MGNRQLFVCATHDVCVVVHVLDDVFAHSLGEEDWDGISDLSSRVLDTAHEREVSRKRL
jgi:hypothetical protein